MRKRSLQLHNSRPLQTVSPTRLIVAAILFIVFEKYITKSTLIMGRFASRGGLSGIPATAAITPYNPVFVNFL
jgi:hypothetical protein